jgi:hypothetical protein
MAAETPICNFGEPARPFDLIGTDGKRYTLEDVRGPKGTLVIFMCNHCPYVKAVVDRMVRDVGALKEHGIGAVAISANDPTRGLPPVRGKPCPGIQRYAALYNVSQATAVGFPGCARRPLPGRLSV